MLYRFVVALSLVIASHLIVPVATEAQSLGVFRWQLQPYCNVLTLRSPKAVARIASRAPMISAAVPAPLR